LRDSNRRESAKPLIDLVDDLGIRNQLRVIDAPEEIGIIQRELESPRLLIADGHHRYETALNYRRARRHENAPSDPEAVRLHDDDAGRMQRSRAGDSADASRGEKRSIATRLPRSPEGERGRYSRFDEIAHREEFRARLEAGRAGGAIGVTLRGSANYFILRLRKPDRASRLRCLRRRRRCGRLDVSVVHALIFDRIFGLKADEIQRG